MEEEDNVIFFKKNTNHLYLENEAGFGLRGRKALPGTDLVVKVIHLGIV